jgi:hypothetical protein
MGLFHLQPTTIAEWQSLVADAEIKAGYAFSDSIENYLVLTLDHYTQQHNLANRILAIDFLEGLQSATAENGRQLRQVGDECLLLSGLFPERALKKNVSLNYFIGMGKQAYLALSVTRLKHRFDPSLYQQLSSEFVGLMDLLNTIRLKNE